MVDRRWAITMLVRFFMIARMVFWMALSVRVSTLEVALSRIRMFGSATNARAMASSWCCPWLMLAPEAVSIMSLPCGSYRILSSSGSSIT